MVFPSFLLYQTILKTVPISIFYTTEEQRLTSNIVLKAIETTQGGGGGGGGGRKDVYSVIEKCGPFFRAEEYHQNYIEKKEGMGMT